MKITDEELLSILSVRLSERRRVRQNDHDVFKELEEVSDRLLVSEKLKSNFLSNIRNEINNPLASVLGLSKLMMSGEITDFAMIRRHAGMIFRNIFSLEFQIKNIVAAAELEAGEIQLQLASVNVEAIIQDVISSFAWLIEEKRLTISWQNVMPRNHEAMLDRSMVELIIINLLANAINYSASGDEIIIRTSLQDGKLTITVQDFGIGIDPAHQTKILERFYQVDSGSTKQHSGHGLGLAIVKEILDIHDGKLTVESAIGKGSVFTICLSVVEAQKSVEDWSDVIFGSEDVL